MANYRWTATGTFDIDQFEVGDEVEPTISLKKTKNLTNSKSVKLENTTPDGTKREGTVDPRDITATFSDFSFPTFIVVNKQHGLVQIQATHDCGATVDIVADRTAKIKANGKVVLNVNLAIKWECRTAAGRLLAVPDHLLLVDGGKNPVTVQLQRPNGVVLAKTTVEARDVAQGGIKNVLQKFAAQAGSGDNLLLTVAT